MNTIKKIGLTALGTSLVASSAIAADFSVSGDAGYTWKSKAIGTTTNDGIGFNSQIAFALPFSSIVYDNFSFSSRNYCFIDAVLPKSLMELALYGNQQNQSYNLDINNSINLFSEHAFGYSKSMSSELLSTLYSVKYREFVLYYIIFKNKRKM